MLVESLFALFLFSAVMMKPFSDKRHRDLIGRRFSMGLDPEKPVPASAARQNFLCHFFRALIHPRNHLIIYINSPNLDHIFFLIFPFVPLASVRPFSLCTLTLFLPYIMYVNRRLTQTDAGWGAYQFVRKLKKRLL